MLNQPKVDCCGKRCQSLQREIGPQQQQLDCRRTNELLTSVDIANSRQCCPNDCCAAAENKDYDYGHPLYQKWHAKASFFAPQESPGTCTVPLIDYNSFLSQHNQQNCGAHGDDFEQKCYMTTKDLERIQKHQEFSNQSRRDLPIGLCRGCDQKNKMQRNCDRNLGGWQNRNQPCDQGQPNRVVGRDRALPIKNKSWPCSNKNDNCLNEAATRCNERPPRKPKRPDYSKGLMSEYRAAYRPPGRCYGQRYTKEELETKIKLLHPAWKMAMKVTEKPYMPSLSFMEAKLEELERIMNPHLKRKMA